MTKIFCDFCEAEIVNEPEGFFMKTVDKNTTFNLNKVGKVGEEGYTESTQIGCKKCKDKLKGLLEKINEV